MSYCFFNSRSSAFPPEGLAVRIIRIALGGPWFRVSGLGFRFSSGNPYYTWWPLASVGSLQKVISM